MSITTHQANDILHALTKLDSTIGSLDSKVVRLEMKVENLNSNVVSLESKVDELDSKVVRLESKVDELDSKADELDSKMDNVLFTTCPQFMFDLPSAIFTNYDTPEIHSGSGEGYWTIVECLEERTFYAMSCLHCCSSFRGRSFLTFPLSIEKMLEITDGKAIIYLRSGWQSTRNKGAITKK